MPRTLKQISDRRPGLRPPQFSVRTLLCGMAIVGALITAAKWMGPVATVIGVIGLLSIFAHVASTAIGGQLRDNGARAYLHENDPDLPHDAPGPVLAPRWVQPLQTEASDFAPATQLSHRKPLDRKLIVWSSALGAVLAAIAGGAALAFATWQRTSVMNVLFGATSSAVLGGLFGFWASSFLQVVSGALAQAHQEIEP